MRFLEGNAEKSGGREPKENYLRGAWRWKVKHHCSKMKPRQSMNQLFLAVNGSTVFVNAKVNGLWLANMKLGDPPKNIWNVWYRVPLQGLFDRPLGSWRLINATRAQSIVNEPAAKLPPPVNGPKGQQVLVRVARSANGAVRCSWRVIILQRGIPGSLRLSTWKFWLCC